MKNLTVIFALLTVFAVSAQLNNSARQGQERKVQVAILFDTSSSMDGLIDQAQTRIWSIINTLSRLNYQGVRPTLEIALYEYGNSTIAEDQKFIRQLNPFLTDLDEISSSLFKLSTNGGSEFCGGVINQSLKDLDWSNYSDDIRLIYIAGNEPFDQGEDDYRDVLNLAKEMDIYVNTIYCGPYEKGVEELWFSGAELGRGKYFNIDSDRKIEEIKTPYDDSIQKMNYALNRTYINYGERGIDKKKMQMQEDENAENMAPSSAVERTVSKSSRLYRNEAWDLVDFVDGDFSRLKTLDKADLPNEMKEMNFDQQKAFILLKSKERTKLQQNIQGLAQKRAEYIQENSSKDDSSDDFGKAVKESIIEFARIKNYAL